jgi:hypothetical protein
VAWYPEAQRMELPEASTQAAIRPTQFITHSIAAPWTARRMYEYWRDSTNLDSHFGLGYEGDLAQYIGTETKADANYRANLRPDGTGAVSIETASNLQHTDPWTAVQMERLIELGVWLHQRHGIPLRICRSASDPGYGYHRMYADWAVSGTGCPGDARVRQFHEIVFPGIVARASSQTPAPAPSEEDADMPQMLNKPNATDVLLQSGQWVSLAFEGTAPIHGPGVRHDTKVKVYFDLAAHPDTRIAGHFFLVDSDGISNPSNFLTDNFKGGGGHTFTCSGDVPAGRALRFEVCATSPDGSPVKLLHRLAEGPYWAL